MESNQIDSCQDTNEVQNPQSGPDTATQPCSRKYKVIQWSPREDEILKDVVSQLKHKKWTQIRSCFNKLAHDGNSVKTAK